MKMANAVGESTASGIAKVISDTPDAVSLWECHVKMLFRSKSIKWIRKIDNISVQFIVLGVVEIQV